MLSNDKRKWRHSGHTRAAETCSSTVATIMRWPRLNWTEPRPGIRKWVAIAAASYAARSRPSCCRSETAALPEVQEQFRNGVFGGAERYCGEATSPQTSMQNLQNLHSATRLIRIPCHHWVVRLVTWHSSPAKRVSGGSVPTERGFRLQFMRASPSNDEVTRGLRSLPGLEPTTSPPVAPVPSPIVAAKDPATRGLFK
ncbi:hypothetical protein CTAM01_03779 [Colletotrichum tamarilloi]|uniref:Uncharacterized protein n=1 Tax=Colletotrichum tamarilloi TaxID=1209934 RepID=A0ABQ9RIJ3_9PEZI|nr:uncharacterized protein CTAM01_03779 [Colletotrichum tamarilloi]KAI3531824.1 hypothetical protein CSPX01_13895 [Colletotrichum filicis]KAK1504472.1 hypothetical protein CTAM01_03779 [Colletotrichum tamarilloi]